MPYIDEAGKHQVKHDGATSSGELNYAITRLCNNYLFDKGLRYATLNEIVGVLECAKLEFYRRMAAGYEDKKKDENGDVYGETAI